MALDMTRFIQQNNDLKLSSNNAKKFNIMRMGALLGAYIRQESNKISLYCTRLVSQPNQTNKRVIKQITLDGGYLPDPVYFKAMQELKTQYNFLREELLGDSLENAVSQPYKVTEQPANQPLDADLSQHVKDLETDLQANNKHHLAEMLEANMENQMNNAIEALKNVEWANESASDKKETLADALKTYWKHYKSSLTKVELNGVVGIERV